MKHGNADGATTNAPVPGGSIKLVDQARLINVEVVSKLKVLGFHKETVVPSGVPPSEAEYGNNSLRVLLPEYNGLLKRLLPAMKWPGQ